MLLGDGATRAARRAARLGAYVEQVMADGGEPSASLLEEFNAAYAVAEAAKLEYAFAASKSGEADDRPGS